MIEFERKGFEQKHQEKLESLKSLKPTHKRISVPESASILKVLEELIQKLEIVDYFEEITSNDEKLKELIILDLDNNDPHPDDEHVENIEHVLIIMCQNHQALVEGKSKIDNEMKKMLIINSTKDINRILMKRSKLLKSIKKEFKETKKEKPELNEMIDLLNELKVFMYERLLVNPTEEKQNHQYLRQMLVNDKLNRQKIEKLKKSKEKLLNLLNDKIKGCNEKIRNLEFEFKETERKTVENIADTKKRGELIKANELTESNQRKDRLMRELNHMKQLQQSYYNEHNHQELQLRKERWKHDGHNENFLRKYDNNFTNKQNKYDEIKRHYDSELAILNELEEKFKPLESEYNQIMEEFNIKEAIRREEEEIFNKWTRVAKTIQCFWIGYRLRKGINKKIRIKKKKPKRQVSGK